MSSGSDRKYDTNCNHNKNRDIWKEIRDLGQSQRKYAGRLQSQRQFFFPTLAPLPIKWRQRQGFFFFKSIFFVHPATTAMTRILLCICCDAKAVFSSQWGFLFKNVPLYTQEQWWLWGCPVSCYLPATGGKRGFDTSIFLFPISQPEMSHIYSVNYISLGIFYF